MSELRAGRVRGHRTESNALSHIVLSIGSIVMVFPFLWQVLASLSTENEIRNIPPTWWPAVLQFRNYLDALHAFPFWDQLGVSIVITILRVTGQVVLCSLAGYAFARMTFAFKPLVFALTMVILMVPSQIYLIPQYQIIQSLGLLNTIPGIILPGIFSAFGTFLMRQFFLGLPRELEEAARLDGANPLQTLLRVVLPLAWPALSALIIITTLWSWNDLLWPLVVATKSTSMPISVGLATLQGDATTQYAILMAASTMAMTPILILFLVMQRRVIDGLAHSGLK